ncbi:GNAT family N-acetyltransferase [Gallaecimonas kandeliae]|uniref:GNAT family N-acetyltransferase n=1 Tax=Gallaecimonas kandeliae TaxID=3029055 RepID=UPI002647F9A2|nr:GNAT family N-acetyltransferase [Gallaecimonas kandeliae]WKE64580.1 GNAT family N-acetyltransferase [Gallaecimonas kandeliae]
MTLMLHSPRLCILPMDERDLPAFAAYRAKPEVARYQSWEDYDLARAKALLAEVQAKPFASLDHWCQLAVRNKTSGALLGDLALKRLADGEAELGLTLAPAHQGQGYATEALGTLVAYLFTELGLKGLQAWVDSRNAPCIRVLERLGFERTGQETAPFKGELCTEYRYQLPLARWQQRQERP